MFAALSLGLTPLPIDTLLPDVVAALEASSALVIEAPPGAGKTTRVPRALLDASFARQGQILVLEPRRLPTRLAAARVASELDERLGETVGYTVRYEDIGGPRTRLRFLTEGVLLRRLLAHPELRGVSAVVLDEFHERHLATDLALGLIEDLRHRGRPDLRVCVMSATLEAEPVRSFLGGCASVRSEGRLFDVSIEHATRDDERPLAEQVAGAVRRVVLEEPDGDVLVFLPGAGDIRRAASALEPLAASKDLLVLPLHGELPVEEQDRAVRRASRRKVILSTNVAESSVTIDGVVAVVDSGLARIAAHSPWTGLPTLRIGKISQASAAQRAGRAGRTRPGRALRLYTRHDFEGRPSHDAAEVARADLSEALLALAALGVREPGRWGWFERPPDASLGAAQELLGRLGAVDAAGAITETGRAMLRFPVHPRLARLVVEGERRGVGSEAATLAALLSERDVRQDARVSFAAGGGGRESADLLELHDAFEQVRAARFSADAARRLGLDARAVDAVERARRQLARVASSTVVRPKDARAVEGALAAATLAAFPDRVGKRRAPGPGEVVLAAGGAARIGSAPPGELVVAVDAEERGRDRRTGGVEVRLAVAIEPEALLDVVGDALVSKTELVWNDGGKRVEAVERLAYGAVVLEETRRPATPSPEASRVLLEAARADAGALVDEGGLADLPARLEVLAAAFPDAGVPAPSALDPAALLAPACEGRVSFAELREADVLGSWLAALPPKVRELLRNDVPERVRLPGGREVRVHYEAGKPPWIESRLQDFFGMAQGPTVCRGRVPLTVHLLAPNQRAVQVTRDLAGFWKQHYPGIRRELCRKYPRHPWPEDGATASPPPPKPPRR